MGGGTGADGCLWGAMGGWGGSRRGFGVQPTCWQRHDSVWWAYGHGRRDAHHHEPHPTLDRLDRSGCKQRMEPSEGASAIAVGAATPLSAGSAPTAPQISSPVLLRLCSGCCSPCAARAPCRRTARSGVASGPSDRGQVPTLRPAPPSVPVGCGRLQGGAGGSGSVDTVQTRRHFGAAQVRAHPPQPDGGPAAGSRHPEAPKFTSRPRCLRAQTG